MKTSINYILEKLGCNKKELAVYLSISNSMFSMILHEQRQPTTKVANKIAKLILALHEVEKQSLKTVEANINSLQFDSLSEALVVKQNLNNLLETAIKKLHLKQVELKQLIAKENQKMLINSFEKKLSNNVFTKDFDKKEKLWLAAILPKQPNSKNSSISKQVLLQLHIKTMQYEINKAKKIIAQL
jgi:transcriptional regulator with XRE-family HTH domain